jgi:hypothetical protein
VHRGLDTATGRAVAVKVIKRTEAACKMARLTTGGAAILTLPLSIFQL